MISKYKYIGVLSLAILTISSSQSVHASEQKGGLTSLLTSIVGTTGSNSLGASLGGTGTIKPAPRSPSAGIANTGNYSLYKTLSLPKDVAGAAGGGFSLASLGLPASVTDLFSGRGAAGGGFSLASLGLPASVTDLFSGTGTSGSGFSLTSLGYSKGGAGTLTSLGYSKGGAGTLTSLGLPKDLAGVSGGGVIGNLGGSSLSGTAITGFTDRAKTVPNIANTNPAVISAFKTASPLKAAPSESLAGSTSYKTDSVKAPDSGDVWKSE